MIDNFLSLTALCAPSIIISKPKFHFLTHLPEFILRFGPALLLSTERYESFNKVYRATSIFSNHMSPSRDSCYAFGSQDIVKHLTTGGSWFSATHGTWVHASSKVMQTMTAQPEFARLLGIPHHAGQSKKSGGYFPFEHHRYQNAKLLTTVQGMFVYRLGLMARLQNRKLLNLFLGLRQRQPKHLVQYPVQRLKLHSSSYLQMIPFGRQFPLPHLLEIQSGLGLIFSTILFHPRYVVNL